MTVKVTKPAVNLREELASLRNQGGYSEQQFYFDSLVTNGDFATDTDWTKGTGWTISGGQALFTSADGLSSEFSQTITVLPNTKYTVSWDVVSNSLVGNELYLVLGGPNLSPYPYDGTAIPNGVKSYTFTTGSVTSLVVALKLNTNINIGDTLVIDNFSFFNVDANDDVIYTMPKGWVSKDVFEDGLLQREGAANDYTVVYDGFDYYVKPTVAPSATTQTTVIGVKA